MKNRYHALDSMRAVMMLLGIYLHVVVGYSGNGRWPYIDPHPTPVLDWSLGLIHAFRMPAFFAMPGFFGALLWERRGAAEFASNRVRRIVLPFLLFWPAIFLIFAAFSWPVLVAMRGTPKDCDGIIPEPLILAAYVVPFGFGWILYGNRDLLPRFERHIPLYLVLQFLGFVVYGSTSPPTQAPLKAAGSVLLCWCLTFAVLGLFLKFASRESARWRYLSDSSYWLYIMHLPVVVGIQFAFAAVPLPALAKIPVVLVVSVLLLVITYDLLVRATWIGILLNGRRYARGLPVGA